MHGATHKSRMKATITVLTRFIIGEEDSVAFFVNVVTFLRPSRFRIILDTVVMVCVQMKPVFYLAGNLTSNGLILLDDCQR